jgi:flavodoxin
MKTEIYFFSGTGNSFFVAKKLTEKIGNSKLIAISNIIHHPIIKSNAESRFCFSCILSGITENC